MPEKATEIAAASVSIGKADTCQHDDLELSATGRRSGIGLIATVSVTCKSCGLKWLSPLGKSGKFTATPSTVFVPQPSNGQTAKPAQTVTGKKPDPSLARSKLKRDGLKAGAVAPEFTLPDIDGGEVSLADFRGKRVLLVFSDVNCGPCETLAPQLQKIHIERRDVQVLVVSRRDVEANRAKAESLGLTYPIVMQKQWEISLKYGMFATPIGYLIDEQGVLLSDVAVGVEPILALLNQPKETSNAST